MKGMIFLNIQYNVDAMREAIKNGKKSEDIVKEFTAALNDAEKQARAEREAELRRKAAAKANAERLKKAKEDAAVNVFNFFKSYYPSLLENDNIETPKDLVNSLDLMVKANNDFEELIKRVKDIFS